MRAPQEAACELRQALRRQKDLQETGRTSALQQGDEVLYEADFGAEEVQGSVLGALPTELEAEASYKVLLHEPIVDHLEQPAHGQPVDRVPGEGRGL